MTRNLNDLINEIYKVAMEKMKTAQVEEGRKCEDVTHDKREKHPDNWE